LNETLQQERIERENAEELAQQKESQRRQDLQPKGSTGRESSTIIATYLLPFNPVRSVNQQSSPLVISAGQKAVRFKIDLGRTAYPGYRISLQTVEGSEVWGRLIKKAQSTATGTSVTFVLPTNIFTRQDYILTVTPPSVNGQAESIADYSFRVERKD
jgi:hypothetical protein